MAIGPVQLIVLGFNHPNFHGEIIQELERLRDSDTVRVIDALAVHKDADGEVEVAHLSNLTRDEAVELGTKVGALIGLGIEGEEGRAPRPAPRPPPTGWRSSATSRPGMCWPTSPTTRRPRSSSSSITGRCRCATRSPGREASASATGSSARWTWSRSG